MGKNTYFELERGVQNGSGKVRTEIKVMSGIFIEGSTDTTNKNSFSIFWKYEY